jgi:hypothetical protein
LEIKIDAESKEQSAKSKDYHEVAAMRKIKERKGFKGSRIRGFQDSWEKHSQILD